MSTEETAKASQCPPWCTDSHDDDAIHRTARVTVRPPDNAGHVSTRIIQLPDDRIPLVVIHAAGEDRHGNLYVPLAAADQLADVLDVLSSLSPAQHQELTAAIRRAAASVSQAVTEPSHDRP